MPELEHRFPQRLPAGRQATSEPAIGTELASDAKNKFSGEGFGRPWPPLIKMDELQRRIHLQACLFATLGTIFITTAFSLLEGVGILHGHGLGWEGTFASVILLYILGNIIFNRRYR